MFDVQSVILSYPWLLKVKYGNCLICLFVFKENHLSCDQQRHCEVILVTAEMKSIHLLVGLVRWNGGQCLLHLYFFGRPWIGPAERALSRDNTLISTGVASKLVEGIQHHRRTSKTLVAYKAQLVLYCPQVVDDGPLILSIFAAPWAVSITGEMLEGIGIMNPF